MLITALVSFPTQAFFGYRIWKFAGRKRIIPILLVPAALFQLAQGIVFVHLNLGAQVGTQLTAFISRAVLISNFAVGAAVDILLSAGLCFLLWKSYMEANSSITETNSMVHRLILFSINTGIWTALVAIATITTVVVYPNNFIYVGFYFLLSPIYCNSLLANLNARSYLRGTGESMVIHLTGIASMPVGQDKKHQGPVPAARSDIESSTLDSTTPGSAISDIQFERRSS
ncbi:hypothetical protein BD779DRAFT_1802265 [Infundibulicybe gibba]|nr:hypothetical protein BD779DRAFT_1802265 [Infundibulicybe gibba]